MRELYQDPINFSVNNQRITGLLHIPEQENHFAIIMCHGWTGNLHSHGLFVECAKKLCESGYTVLRFDYRGSEHSEGIFENITIKSEIHDLIAAIKFISRKKGCNNRIGILGYSLGSLISLLAWKKEIKAMVLWSSIFRPLHVFTRIIGEKKIQELKKCGYTIYLKTPSPYRYRLEYRIGISFFEDIKTINIKNKVKNIKCPISIIHGNKDITVSSIESEALYNHLRNTKELTMINGANHFFEKEEHRKQLYETSIKWFNRWLK
jgi:esterase/lipase